MDCSKAIVAEHLKKVVIPLKIVAVSEPSEKSCWSSEKSCHSSEKKKWFVRYSNRPSVSAMTVDGVP